MTNPVEQVVGANVSEAWARAYLKVVGSPGNEVAPLVVTFTGVTADRVEEHPDFRAALDACLLENDMQKVDTVAGTIFPQSLWNFARDRAHLYEEYKANLPWYCQQAMSKNRRGLYFARLTGFDMDPKTAETHEPKDTHMPGGNQLEFIIENCKKGKRRSMFQAAIFDPHRDSVRDAQLGFPCLQHIQVLPDFDSKSLDLNAFYATQQIFEKGYGNYLGLARLASFIAGEVGIEKARVTCFIGVEKMEKRPKTGTYATLRSLVDILSGRSPAAAPTGSGT